MLVLVADDDKGVRLAVRHLLVNTLGWNVIECSNGAEALLALAQNRFDLALIDINMPQLDGIGVVEAIRSSPTLRHTRIMMMTADAREEVVRRLLLLGVSDYIIKPLVPKTALEKLHRISRAIIASNAMSPRQHP